MARTTRTAPTTPAERKALSAERKRAERIAKMRKAGASWDDVKSAGLCKTAPQGRALLRKFDLVEAAGGIAASYERSDAFRASESERRQAKVNAKATPAPKRTARKATPKAKATRRPRKVA
jgi:hypothetical protein